MAVNKKLNFNVTFGITAAVLLGIVVFFNGVVGRVDLGRFDLTEEKLYTVSPAAKRVLGKLQVPVQLKFYITKKEDLPTQLQTLERDVVDKLSEFKLASNGNLDFSVADPSSDDELAERLATKNVRPFQVQTIDRDAMGIKLVYSAITIAYKDKQEEVLPQILPQSLTTLEYDICAAVTRLTRDINPVVAIYASRQTIDPQLMQMYLQMGQQPPEPQDLYQSVLQVLQRESYDARRVEITADSPIPEEAVTLVMLAPKNLNERQLYEINKFTQQGGNLIVAVQNYEYSYAPNRRGGFNLTPTQSNSGLARLLDGYGVSVSDKLLMDANMEVLSIPSERNIGGMRLQVAEPVQAPIQISVTADQLNQDFSVTNRISQLLYLWGTSLDVDETKTAENGLEVTTLFTSSDNSWQRDFTPGPLSQEAMQPDANTQLRNAPLAVMLEGTLPNLFADGTIPSWNAAADTTVPPPVETFTPVDTKLVVVGCAKMFDDSLIQAGGNGLFLLNSVDAMTLGEDIIQIRSKAISQRVLEPVSDGQKLFFRFFVVGFVPLLVALFGFVRSARRRREQAMFLAAQSA